MTILSLLKVKGHSMEPGIKTNSRVLVSGIYFLFGSNKIGDVVAFKMKNELFIKRIKRVQGDKFFVAGDNKNDSLDSRTFGEIEKMDIIGKVIFKLP